MRRLIESLRPRDREIYWKWVGSMFALYVVMLIAAAVMVLGHQTSRNPTREDQAAAHRQRSIGGVPIQLKQAAGYQ